MQPAQIRIDYPPNYPDALQTTPDGFAEEARMAMAVKLFELDRLSSGMAAQLAGIDRVSFLLHRFGVPMIDLSDEELRSDLEHA